jgi:SAM-dependent methyltransferase
MTPADLRAQGHDAKAIAGFLGSEGVPSGGCVLDAPCGIGRRAIGLAAEGFHVTAVDPNEIGVDAARSRIPPDLRDRLRFLHAARESLPGLGEETFDAIVALDHPIGRQGPGEDVAFLARLIPHIRGDGVLVLELLHRDFFATRPDGFSFHVLADVEQHEFRSFDPVTGILHLTWTFYHREGEDLRHRGDATARMRLPTPHEAASLLGSSGWRLAGAFGGWSREPVSADRRKVVLVARRVGSTA